MGAGTHRQERGVGPSAIGLAPRLGDLLFALRQGAIGSAITGEGGSEVSDLARRFGIEVYSREDGHRRSWSNTDMGSLLANRATAGAPVVSYAALDPGHPAAADMAACDATLKARVDDATFAWPALAAAGVPVPHHALVTARELAADPDRLARWGFVRVPRSSAGAGVAPATPAGLDRIAAGLGPTTALLVSRSVGDGRSLNYHALVGADGAVTVHPPSLQLIGTVGVALHPTQFCGNDFAAVGTVAGAVRSAADAAAGAAARWLAGLGHRGLCGIDVAIGDDGVAVVDVNPRLQASTWLLTEAAAAAGRPCPGRDHLRAFGLAALSEDPSGPPAATDGAPDLAQVILRAGATRRGRAVNGVYRRTGGRWSLQWTGAVPADLDGDEVLVSGVPDHAWSVGPGAVVGRVVCRRAVTDDGRTLNGWGRELLALHRVGGPD